MPWPRGHWGRDLSRLISAIVAALSERKRTRCASRFARQLDERVRVLATRLTPGALLGEINLFASAVCVSLELLDGDVMVLVTDGITDSFATERDVLGLQRLLEVVERGPRDLTGLCADLLSSAEVRGSHDDVTVIAMGRSTWAIGHPLSCSASPDNIA